jgi:hypothetical protein
MLYFTAVKTSNLVYTINVASISHTRTRDEMWAMSEASVVFAPFNYPQNNKRSALVTGRGRQ